MSIKPWDDVLEKADLQVFKRAGFGKKLALGSNPALIVIDATYTFLGDRPEPILQSIQRFPNSCGEQGWRALRKIKTLLNEFRSKDRSVYYTIDSAKTPAEKGGWLDKNARAVESINGQQWDRIVDEVTPKDGEFVIQKSKPSAFFGTNLLSHLIRSKIDTLIVTGCTTSGCVRATAVDAFSYSFKVVVVQDCVFDRGELSHKVSLFDIQNKYGDVLSSRQAIRYLKSLGENEG